MPSKKSPKKQTAAPSSRTKPSAKAKPKPAAAKKSAAAKKPAAAKKQKPGEGSTKKVNSRKTNLKPAPSRDAVAHAAYLNYRRRVEKGLPGDSHGDWLEAERQLGVRK